jgi:hypothetical protein
MPIKEFFMNHRRAGVNLIEAFRGRSAAGRQTHIIMERNLEIVRFQFTLRDGPERGRGGNQG